MRETIQPSYLYQQYADDAALQAFVDSYNAITQIYLNTFNTLNLPIYTSSVITGELLDWVAVGLYGIYRPSLSDPVGYTSEGAYNTVTYNVVPYSGDVQLSPGTSYVVTDDYYKRIITWNFYKADGFQFTCTWLKRRIYRFLYGVNGVAPDIQSTYNFSVTYSAPSTITIQLIQSEASLILNSAIQARVLALPFNYTFVVTYLE